MAKKKERVGKSLESVIAFTVPTEAIIIEDMDDAIAALEQMEAIEAAISEAQKRSVELKKEVTAWSNTKKVTVIQLDDHYYRNISRSTRVWNPIKLKKLTEEITVKIGGKKKSLWLYITKRVPDAEKIDLAVKKGYISQKKVEKAYETKPQAPFLQKYLGTGDDGE